MVFLWSKIFAKGYAKNRTDATTTFGEVTYHERNVLFCRGKYFLVLRMQNLGFIRFDLHV